MLVAYFLKNMEYSYGNVVCWYFFKITFSLSYHPFCVFLFIPPPALHWFHIQYCVLMLVLGCVLREI